MREEEKTGADRVTVAENALEQLRASMTILERIALDPDVVPPLRRRVTACVEAFVGLPEPSDPSFDARMSALEKSLDATRVEVRQADLQVPHGTFRRKLDPSTLEPEQLAAYARAMASMAPLSGGPRQRRFETAVTHALCSETSSHRLELRPEAVRRRLVDYIVEGMPGERTRRDEIDRFLADARTRLDSFRDTEQMFQANFDRDVRKFRDSLGRNLFDPEILQELVEFDVEFGAATLSLPASSHPMSLPPPRIPSEKPKLSARDAVEDARDRVAAIADVLSMVREADVKRELTELVEHGHQLCRDALNGLGERDEPGFDQRLAKVREALTVGEVAALDVDGAVSMGTFRSWYDRRAPDEDVLKRYARLLTTRRLSNDLQQDRFEFVITRLLSRRGEDGRIEMRPRSEAAPLLEYVLPPDPHIREHERSGAVMFFRDATLQLSTLHRLDDVFSGGFYLDVRGYKVALRGQLLDGDVLYAAVALNVAIHNRLEEMRELEARSKNSLANMLRQEDAEVRKTLGGRTPSDEDRRFEETRRYLQKYRQNVGPPGPARRVARRTIVRGLGAVAIVAGAIVAGRLFFRDENDIVELPSQDLARLSPVLEAGGFSDGSSAPTFIGRVSSARWMLLTPEERRDAAESIRGGLARRSVRAAWITRDGHQAIHIADGEIVSVR